MKHLLFKAVFAALIMLFSFPVSADTNKVDTEKKSKMYIESGIGRWTGSSEYREPSFKKSNSYALALGRKGDFWRFEVEAQHIHNKNPIGFNKSYSTVSVNAYLVLPITGAYFGYGLGVGRLASSDITIRQWMIGWNYEIPTTPLSIGIEYRSTDPSKDYAYRDTYSSGTMIKMRRSF